MSWNSDRDAAVYRVRGALDECGAREIKLPKSVTAAVAVLDRVASTRPVEPSPTAIREAILAGSNEVEINALLLAELAYTRLRVEHKQAHIDAAVNVLQAIGKAHDDVYPQLKALADKRITQLEAVAALDGASLETLVREGRHDDARALAEVDVAAADLVSLYEMYAGYVAPGGYKGMCVGDFDCTRFRNPEVAYRDSSPNDTVAQAFVRALQAGGRLWFPTGAEAVDAATPLHREQQREAERLAEIRRSQGLTVAFT